MSFIMWFGKFIDKYVKIIKRIYTDKNYKSRFSLAVTGIVFFSLIFIFNLIIALKTPLKMTIGLLVTALILALLVYDAYILSKKKKTHVMTNKEEEFLKAMAVANNLDPYTFKAMNKNNKNDDKPLYSGVPAVVESDNKENDNNANPEEEKTLESDKPKVILLGDSIRLNGYGCKVAEMLKDEFEVWQPEDNGKFVSNILRELFTYKDVIDKADIIHFNSGEWDICNLFDDGPFTPKDFYVSQIERIVDILQKKGKTVIFATTTPVRPNNRYNSNSVIAEYNDAIVPVLMEKNVKINDLYSLVYENIYSNISDDLIHLSDKGIDICSKATCNIIRSCI